MPEPMDYQPGDVDTAARTVWGEARGEGSAGMAAVAWVIRNRAQAPGWWGRTIKTVCLKPWQFSCWNANDPNASKCRAVTHDNREFRAAVDLCAAVFRGELPDPTAGADSYYDDSIRPPVWAVGKKPCARIGHLIFYRVVLPPLAQAPQPAAEVGPAPATAPQAGPPPRGTGAPGVVMPARQQSPQAQGALDIPPPPAHAVTVTDTRRDDGKGNG